MKKLSGGGYLRMCLYPQVCVSVCELSADIQFAGG